MEVKEYVKRVKVSLVNLAKLNRLSDLAPNKRVIYSYLKPFNYSSYIRVNEWMSTIIILSLLYHPTDIFINEYVGI